MVVLGFLRFYVIGKFYSNRRAREGGSGFIVFFVFFVGCRESSFTFFFLFEISNIGSGYGDSSGY